MSINQLLNNNNNNNNNDHERQELNIGEDLNEAKRIKLETFLQQNNKHRIDDKNANIEKQVQQEQCHNL